MARVRPARSISIFTHHPLASLTMIDCIWKSFKSLAVMSEALLLTTYLDVRPLTVNLKYQG
jgi:hypothetical protein